MTQRPQAFVQPSQTRRKRLGWILLAATAFAGFAILLTIPACSVSTRSRSEENWMDYLETTQRLEREGATLEPGSVEERQAIERFENLLSDFKADDFGDRIRDVYAEEAFFNDTLKTVRGVVQIEEYLLASADAIHEGKVEFLDVVSQNGNYYFRWAMSLRFKRLAGGDPKASVGMTHIRFDRQGKVLLHQDFWDSSGGLFEHVPALGWVLRRAKEKL